MKCVFNLKIATALIKAKHILKHVETNRDDENFLVFKFEETPELLQDFERIKANVC